MDSKAHENVDVKAEFRKPSNESANRKYRRRSSVSGSSSSSDGSRRERSSSRFHSKSDIAKLADDKVKRNVRDLDRDYGRNHSSRSGDSFKYTDQQSSRGYHKHDDRNRCDKRVGDYDRGYSKSSYRSLRDPQDSRSSNYSRGDREHLGSRDYPKDVDKHSRENSDGSGNRNKDKNSTDRTGFGRKHSNIEERGKDKERDSHREIRGCEDGKKDYKSSFVDLKGNLSVNNKELECKRHDSYLTRDCSGYSVKEHAKELDGDGKYEGTRRHDTSGYYNEQYSEKPEEHSTSDGTKAFSSEGDVSVAKKPKLSNLDCSVSGSEGVSEQMYVTDSDINAAKIAAMKASELVNRNLVGAGLMSFDQKKKLLWGNKKNTDTVESTHHWDAANFGDRERQEKFNKLMGVKGNAKVENQSDNPGAEKQMEQLQLELEKQYTAGLRRRDGRTVGLGL